jgi:hypothetical protein
MPTTESDQALISLERAKKHAGITSTEDDAELVRLINEVSARFSRFCGRRFVSDSYTHDGTTLPRLVVRHPRMLWAENMPITAVSSLVNYSGGQTITESTDGGVSSTGYVIHADMGLIELVGYEFPYLNRQTVELTYTAGYQATNADAEQLQRWGLEERAGDLVTACAMQVAWTFHHKDRTREGIASVSSGGSTVAYLTDEYLPEVLEVLQAYRRALPS